MAKNRKEIEKRILVATRELLAEGISFADLNIEMIATRAGISRTAFYFYFDDKHELLLKLTHTISEEIYEEAEIWWKDGNQSRDRDQLKQALSWGGELYLKHGTILKAIVEVSTYDLHFATIWRSLLSRFVETAQQRIEEEQAAGRALELPASETAFALVWMTERTYYQHLVQETEMKHEDLAEALCQIWLRTIYGELKD